MEHVRVTASPDARVARTAEAQHGVVELRQLLAAGLTRGAIYRRVRAGRLHPRARDARLTALGYRVVRFTFRQVAREGRVVAGTLRVLLRQDSAPVPRNHGP